MQTHFHYRARALVYKNGFLLVCTPPGYAYLPGGHIEDGESASSALQRELKEELGYDATIKSFLGAIESSWVKDETLHHEINLIFAVEISGLDPSKEIIPTEEKLNFLWIKPDDMKNKKLLPVSAPTLVRKWIAGDNTAWWGSSMAY